ncbi:MAG: GNAT family N-acetyltransferase [Hyphomonadaceae bacterium]
MSFTVKVHTELRAIDETAWDQVANPAGARYDPFLSWAFLEAMESTGAATPQTGWSPCHLTLESEDGPLLGAMPLYAKTHSRGEFVFDHSWAGALENAGGQYYPKLLSGVPFTPVTGRRLLVPDGPDAHDYKLALVSTALQLARENEFSSLHINFVEATEADTLSEAGLLHRIDQQFRWQNDGYSDFDDFLARLSSAKRKNLRKERKKAQSGLDFKHLTGDAITEADWDQFFDFYLDTGNRKWGSPYLHRDTFSVLHDRLADKLLLIFAYEDGVPIAGALNLIGSDTLYGRYWGTRSSRSMLHFEVCYYQAIDYAIANNLTYVEAGAQGGHKLARGYAPMSTHSVHWLAHSGLHDAVAEYLDREREAVAADQAYLQDRTPFKKEI